MSKLSDFFLQSGFESQYYGISELDPRFPERMMEQLREAILRALQEGDLLPPEVTEEMLQNPDLAQNEELRDLIDHLIERMMEEGYISPQQQQPPQITPPPRKLPAARSAKTSRNSKRASKSPTRPSISSASARSRICSASLGKSSFGRHDTRELATGVESGGASRPYEFGDTLNLDISATLVQRRPPRRRASAHRTRLSRPDGPPVRIPKLLRHRADARLQPQHDSLRRRPLHARQARGPGALASDSHAVSRRFAAPGSFHDSAEEVPLGELARVQVGPYYTNTREGLRLAQRILSHQKKDMRQIVMITDGKPSALTLEDGRIYKNAFGLDPLVVTQTLEEVAKCRKSGILINTFMLASDYSLVHFVQKVTEICRGKAYFTTPYTLGQYLLMDYMSKRKPATSTSQGLRAVDFMQGRASVPTSFLAVATKRARTLPNRGKMSVL